MHAFSGQGIQVNRERCYKGFPFTGAHLRDLTLVEYDTTDKLNIIVHHIPFDKSAPGSPFVFV